MAAGPRGVRHGAACPGAALVELALAAGAPGWARRCWTSWCWRRRWCCRTTSRCSCRSRSAPPDDGRPARGGDLLAPGDRRRRTASGRRPATPAGVLAAGGDGAGCAVPGARGRRRVPSRSSVDGLYAAAGRRRVTTTARCSRGCGRPGGTATSVYAEVALPDGAGAATAFGAAPGAARRGAARRACWTRTPDPRWTAVLLVRVSGSGPAVGSRVRVRIAPADGSGVAGRRRWTRPGAPVAVGRRAGAPPGRPGAAGGRAAGGQSSLFRLDWVPVPAADAPR